MTYTGGPRCRPGDLAVVINAYNTTNVGRIVKVIGLHDGKGELNMNDRTDTVWLVGCPAGFLRWARSDGRVWRRKCGPIPDVQLQPIRGDRSERAFEKPVGVSACPADLDALINLAKAMAGPGICA